MKKLGLLLIVFLTIPIISVAQDRIIKTDNTMLTVKIYEIGEEVIRYKPFDNQDGPVFTMNIATIHKIILENGSEFDYNPLGSTPPPAAEKTQPSSRAGVGNISTQTNASNTDNTDPESIENKHNTAYAAAGFFNIDFSNSSFEDEVSLFIFETTSFDLYFPMAGTDIDEDEASSHGVIGSFAAKFSIFDNSTGSFSTTVTTFLLNAGVGYGYTYGTDLRAYATLNTTAFYLTSITTSSDTINDNEFFPSDSGFLRLGAHWTPFGSRRNPKIKWGFHAAVDNYFVEGSEPAFLLGISLKEFR